MRKNQAATTATSEVFAREVATCQEAGCGRLILEYIPAGRVNVHRRRVCCHVCAERCWRAAPRINAIRMFSTEDVIVELS